MLMLLLVLMTAGITLVGLIFLTGITEGQRILKQALPEGIPSDGDRLRVLYTAGSLEIGGAERVALGLMCNLDATRYQVIMLIRDGSSAVPVFEATIRRATSRGMVVIRKRPRPTAGDRPRLIGWIGAVHDAGAEWTVYRALRPEILHCHLVLGFPAQGKKLLARLARIPTIISTYHQFPLSHAPSAHRPYRGLVDRVIMRMLDRSTLWMLQHLDAGLIATSPEEGAAHAAAGIPPEKIVVISNGIDLSAYRSPPSPTTLAAIRQSLGIPPGAFIFGHLGRMNRQKAQDQLLEAGERLLRDAPDAWIVIAGEGPERPSLERQVAAIPDSEIRARILLRPAVPDADVPTWHGLFDAFVLSSRFEGQGLVNMEAMAAGRPIVAFRVGGVASTVGPDAALLVPPADVAALAAAMRKLAQDRDLAHRMGAAGRERAFQLFDEARCAREHQQFYQRLVAARRGRG